MYKVMKKIGEKKFPSAIADIIKDFAVPMTPDEIPDDSDWHQIITVKQSILHGDKNDVIFSHPICEVGFYDRKINGWTLGRHKPNWYVNILAWDGEVRMKNTNDRPIINEEGMIRLMEQVIHDSCECFRVCYREYLKSPSQKNKNNLSIAESGVASWMVPGKTHEEIIDSLKAEVEREMQETDERRETHEGIYRTGKTDRKEH